MIHDIELALAVNQRFSTTDFVVSENVLRQVLRKQQGNGEGLFLQANVLQDSFHHRYLSRIVWKGLTFIHLSSKPLHLEPAKF